MRLFLAVEVSQRLRSGLALLREELTREGVRGVRWVDPEGIHLTLRFCGEVAPDAADRLHRALSPGAPHSPFICRPIGLGVFPSRGAPRVLWLGVDGKDHLAALADWVEAKVVSAGLPREPRPFHPHLTLGRFRPGSGQVPPELLGQPREHRLGEWPVEQVVLFRSHLGPSGARYEPLSAYPLRGDGASGGPS